MHGHHGMSPFNCSRHLLLLFATPLEQLRFTSASSMPVKSWPPLQVLLGAIVPPAFSSSVSAACRYMLSRTAAVTEELRAAYENYQFARFYQACAASCHALGSMSCCKCEHTGSGLPAYLAQHTMCMLLQAVQRFAVTELSNFYLDVAKDRLYVRSASSPDRRYF